MYNNRLETQLEKITLSSLTSEAADNIKYSLYLPIEIEGSEEGDVISWKSDNTSVITNSGRVIRPWSDEKPETVNLTVIAKNGNDSAAKTFTLTVQPDSEFYDPQFISEKYMSDEEFFGNWNSDKSTWETEGKFDYTRDDLKKIEVAVKKGDYSIAAKELLEYMKTRTVRSPVELLGRNDEYADMPLDDIFLHADWSYLQGGIADVEASEYAEVSIPLRTSVIAKGGTNTYSLMARYNECSSLVVLSKESGHGAKIALVVNGEERFYSVDADATVRTGQYKNTNYGFENEMEVKTFGEFLGDDTSHVLLRFRFPDLSDSDDISAARLIVTAKVAPAFAGTKSIIAHYEPNNTWDEATVCYNSLLGCVYNYNGVPGGTDWGAVEGCDYEYLFSMTRFHGWRNAATAYIETGDERYGYKMIRLMMHFIYRRGFTMHSPDVSWGNQEIRGGWKRTLDTAERLRSWVATVDTLMKSRYMTPDCCKAILKHIWDMNDGLLRSVVKGNNWAQNEGMAILQGALTFPEFSNSKRWIEYGMEKNEALIYRNHFPDGTYAESTGGYSITSFLTFVQYKKLMFDYGINVSAEYDEMLHNAAYYNLLLRGPDGECLQYGDERAGKSRERIMPQLSGWYNDTDIEFIDSFGKSGTEPNWTSRLFPESRVTMMRANWTTTSPYIFTNVRGSGGHGDEDDNSVTAIAYGRILLCDAGVFTYRRTDPYSIWGRSAEAHNTVEVNGVTQSEDTELGTIHNWITNSIYDFISQSSDGYSYIGVVHRRTITFIKPNVWIVSDLMTPSDETAGNSYKQIWHMLPTSGLATDCDNHTIYSNYSSGANIVVASADVDAEVVEKDGWYDYGYQNLASSRFAFFQKNDVAGKTTFDTVLIPYEQGKAKVDIERIALDVDTTVATALKFNSDVDGEKSTTYYMLNYSCDSDVRTMKDYTSNAQLTVVRIGENEEITEIIIANGSKVTNCSGNILLDCGKVVESFAYHLKGTALEITTTENSAEGVTMCINTAVSKLSVNGHDVSFSQNESVLTIGS